MSEEDVEWVRNIQRTSGLEIPQNFQMTAPVYNRSQQTEQQLSSHSVIPTFCGNKKNNKNVDM